MRGFDLMVFGDGHMRISFERLWAEFRKLERRSLHMFKSELQLSGQQLNSLATAFDVIHQRFSEDNDLRIIWMYHIGKTITSFEGAISHTLRGLFSESANDIRVGLETLWQLLYLHDNAAKRTKWLNDEKITTSEVRKGLSVASVRWAVYDEFCAVSHPRKRAMEWYYTYIHGNVRYGPTFEPEYIRNHVHNVNRFLGWIQEDIIYRLYPGTFGSALPDLPDELVKQYVSNRDMYRRIYGLQLNEEEPAECQK